jgi:cytochrome b pre-mRNA-processing protein 3
MLNWLRKRNEVKRSAASLYEAIVAQSRLPHFYTESGVPDTVEGRFEVIVLHIFLVLDRLKNEVAAIEPLIYQIGEAFIDELDGAMREMGVGDTSVPKKMRLAASGFLGRLEAYHKALHQDGQEALLAALIRNVYGGDPASAARASKLATYVTSSAASLRQQALADLRQGRVSFLAPSGASNG